MVNPLPRHQVLVDDNVLPARIAGHPALDLCNSWAGWGADGSAEESGTEYLLDAAALGSLARDRTDLGEHPRARGDAAHRLLADARRLRAATYAVLVGDPAADDLASIWALSAESRARSTPRMLEGRLRWQATPSTRAPLHAFAEAVTELLASDLVDRVRRCPGEGCGWLFLDRSGRRRWCDMAVCGNRAKVRAYARRRPAQ